MSRTPLAFKDVWLALLGLDRGQKAQHRRTRHRR
jgi:hypothetical protein